MELKDLYNIADYKDSNGMMFNNDCFEIMKDIPDKSVDCIICDLPYQRTKNKWDIIIPFEPLWKQYNRIIKNNGAVVLFADGLFMVDLMDSNRKMWRYNLIWDKVLTSGFLNANRQPLRQHEEICVFYKKQPIYNPQKFLGKKNHTKGKPKENKNNNYNDFDFVDNSELLGNMKHPTSILTFSRPHSSIMKHPTQKSIDLLEYLVKTYTNENDLVLDNCMGSGTTCVACKNLNRRYIGIEKEKKYFDIACERLNKGE